MTERTDGAARIMAERDRHLEEGYTVTHDDKHTTGALVRAARAYLNATVHGEDRAAILRRASLAWPHELSTFKPVEGDPVATLVKAGSLIAAEIDRLLRAEVSDA